MIVTIIVFAVFSIGFCVLVFMSSKTWLWRHVFLLFGVFVMTMLFLVLGANLLQTHKVWRGKYVDLTNQIERADLRMVQLRGPLSISEDEPSLPQLQADLSRMVLQRGRVRRGARMSAANDESVTLDMTGWNNTGCVRKSVDEAGQDQLFDAGEEPQPPVAEPHQIVASTLLHVFINGAATELTPSRQQLLFGDGDLLAQETRRPCTVPSIYLGHFVVSAADDASVTLRPVYPLDESQRAALNETGEWTLYEVLPADDHEVLAGLPEESIRELLQPSDQIPADRVDQVVHEYLRDQTEAQVDDPPERIWSKVRFISDHTIEVDVEAGGAAEDERSFDTRGRAIPADLQQGRPSSFKAGDVALFDSQTANRLVQQGVAELLDEPARYVRRLRNYELIFRFGTDTLSNLEERIRVTGAEIASLTDQIAKVRERIVYREQEVKNLQHDLEGFRRDQVAAQQVRDQLQQRRTAQLATLSQLFQANVARDVVVDIP